MGSKIRKILATAGLVAFGLGLFNMTGNCYQIPETTLRIAQQKMMETAQQQGPTSEVIRVGIGSQNFGTYNHKEISVYGTDTIAVYDGNKFIVSLPSNTNVGIRLSELGNYDLYTGGRKIDELKGPVHFVCNNGLLGVTDLKRAGKPALYHGAFEVIKSVNSGFLNLVNMVEVEEYLKGVVPNEMPVRFGLEALKAQSVTARNYVLSPRVKASPNYDVVDSVASQVYYGANTEKEVANCAVQETEGIVALYNEELILAQYSSTAGGYTEDFSNAFSDPKTKAFPSVEKPYLVAQPDMPNQHSLEDEADALEFYSTTPESFDVKSPYYRWQREWAVDELRESLQSTLVAQSLTGFVSPAFESCDLLGDITGIRVVRRGKSGKIIELVVETTNRNYHIFKELVIRRAFVKDGKALPSANVVFVPTYDASGKLATIKAFGGGYGHGVGMSQFGAGYMATELGKTYRDILFHYYTGITLATKPVVLSRNNNFITQTFWADKGTVNLVVNNTHKLSTIVVNINGKDKIFPLESHILGGNVNRIDITKFLKTGKNKVVYQFVDDGKNGDKSLKVYVEVGKSNDRG